MENITAREKLSKPLNFNIPCIELAYLLYKTLVVFSWLDQTPLLIIYGSVFGVMNTKIVLEGMLHFKNNSAYIGSVFNVIGSSWFILNDGLNATFIGNSAVTKGGAIYAYSEQTQECMFTTAPNGSNNISICSSIITQLAILGVLYSAIIFTIVWQEINLLTYQMLKIFITIYQMVL